MFTARIPTRNRSTKTGPRFLEPDMFICAARICAARIGKARNYIRFGSPHLLEKKSAGHLEENRGRRQTNLSNKPWFVGLPHRGRCIANRRYKSPVQQRPQQIVEDKSSKSLCRRHYPQYYCRYAR